MKTVTVEVPEGKEARWIDGVLTLVEEHKDITDKIKTFSDAEDWCRQNGYEQVANEYYEALGGLIKYPSQTWEDIAAYLKLRVITCALNEGWFPIDDDLRWYAVLSEKGNVGVFYHKSDELGYGIPKKIYFKTPKLAKYAATQFEEAYLML